MFEILSRLATRTLIVALRYHQPGYGGTVTLPGLTGAVEIRRDTWGVPHVYAQTDGDVFQAQGYIHAHDRLWQMELQRRLGRGQLAAIFGRRALRMDRFVRVLGFAGVAETELAALSDETRAFLAAYVRGVNAYIAQHRYRLPLEFLLLRCRPRPWEILDVLILGKIHTLNLCGNWMTEILRQRLVAELGPERLADIEPRSTGPQCLHVPRDLADDGRLAAALSCPPPDDPKPRYDPADQGSNAWAVGPQRSATGRALLGADPHLNVGIPSVWYENHLDGPTYRVAGASLPGIPGVIIGHNESIAWGVTNAPVDVQDLFVEQIDDQDEDHYTFRGNSLPVRTVSEEITVRGEREPHSERVRWTHHGPIISDFLLSTEEQARSPMPSVALRWTALEPGRTNEAILELNRAHDWESFRAALAHWTAPPQTMVYSDVAGHVGYSLCGRIPRRGRGDGRLPVPGWSGEYEWTGCIPVDNLPCALDPPDGLVVCANQQPAPTAPPGEWDPGYRANRIRELLVATRAHTVDSFVSVQADEVTLLGRQVAELFLDIQGKSQIDVRAADRLRGWDGAMQRESPAALIADRLSRKLMEAAYEQAGPQLRAAVGPGGLPGSVYLSRAVPDVMERARRRDDNWLPAGLTWDCLLRRVWREAMVELENEFGSQVDQWRYGRCHRITLRHLLAKGPLLGPLFNRGPFPVGGDANTVDATHRPYLTAGFEVSIAPTYRLICPVGDWNQCLSINSSGQSGWPGSIHYEDNIPSWLGATYRRMYWDRQAVEDNTRELLLTVPGRP